MHTGSPGHLKTFDYLGPRRYSLTFCTFGRTELFTTADRVDLVTGQILRAANEQSGQILVYTFMPDHAHLLIQMEHEASDCLQFISIWIRPRASRRRGFVGRRSLYPEQSSAEGIGDES